ncbi:MAG: hypothetical protein J0M09_17650 [Xanthomonadales bacterium]|nr:hypothetical protein [Xanthomonadales bacterium]
MSPAAPDRPRIALLTGRSDPQRWALSPTQHAMLDQLARRAEGIAFDPHNFPWPAHSAPWRHVPLLRASLANGRQYLAARRGTFHGLTSVQADHARGRLLAAPRTLLLVGSCGLALLDALIAPFDHAQRARLRVVAYGAVGLRWPQRDGMPLHGVQLRGDRDRIAAWLGPRNGPRPRMIAAGHMDYLDHPPARDAVFAAACEQLDWLRHGA